MEKIALVTLLMATTLIGYKIISQVPSLLHTPLMSGMNALSGLTVLSCLTTTAGIEIENALAAKLLGYIAIVLATINIFSGFSVTERMLKFFRKSNS